MKISHNQRLVLTGAVYIILFNIISNILAYFVRRLFVSNLGAYQYGMYTFFLSVVIMVNLLRDPGVAGSMSLVLPKEPYKDHIRAVLRYTTYSLIVACNIMVLGIFIADYALSMAQVFSILLFCVAYGFYNTFVRFLNGLEKHFLYAARFVIINFGLLLAVFFVDSFERMLLVYATMALIFSTISYYVISPMLTSGTTKRVTEYFQLGLPIILYSMLAVILTRMDIVMVGLLMNAANVADYDLVLSLAVPLTIFVSLISSIFLPIFTRLSNKNRGKVVQEVQALLLIILLPVASVLIYFKQELFEFLYPDITLTLGVYSILLCSVLVYCLATVRINQIIAEKKTKSIAGAFIIVIVSNLLFNGVLIPIYGLYGAAISTLLSNVILYVIYNHKNVLRHMVPIASLFTIGAIQLSIIGITLVYYMLFELPLTKQFISRAFIKHKNK